jgi:hypothetical protein
VDGTARRLDTTEVDASHAVVVSRPALVTDVILDAARTTR